MAIYVATGMQFFDGPDTWAQGNAQWVKDNTQALAAQTALVAPGTAAERTSWFGAFRLEDDGTLAPVSAWHLDAEGTVRDGLPVTPDGPDPEPDPAVAPAWEPGIAVIVGAQYTYGGATYTVVQAHTTQTGWEPPSAPALWASA